MLTATRRWSCDKCQTDIHAGQNFDIIDGAMYCKNCIDAGRHLEHKPWADLQTPPQLSTKPQEAL